MDHYAICPEVTHENEFAKHDVNLVFFFMPWRSRTALLGHKKKRWLLYYKTPIVVMCVHLEQALKRDSF